MKPEIIFKLIFFSLIIRILYSCEPGNKNQDSKLINDTLQGEIVIFHAGSLSVPFKELADSFRAIHPGVKILTESAGSLATARKLTDLGKTCDIVAVSDYKVIDDMLIPDHAAWNLQFTTNEMTLVFTDKSKYSGEITILNWPEILQKKEVRYGRSDPDSDPCGYRTVMCTQLAEDYYKLPGFSQKLLAKDNEMIRPKEVDLLALLETQAVDYIFLYRSVAIQHQLKYLLLPDEINLKVPALAERYSKAVAEIPGDEPGKRRQVKGEPMVYSFTIPKNAPNYELAVQFAEFMLDPEKGLKILEKNGQPALRPSRVNDRELLPESLKKYTEDGGK